MKRLSIIMCLWLSALSALAVTYTNETLHYKVMYKWGLISKQAGRATLTIKDAGNHYASQLTARSESWVDHMYMVRDTLNGTILKDGFKPTFYEKIAHEGGEDKHDIVRFSYEGNNVTGHCLRHVVKDGEVKANQTQVLNASGATVDMLSSFYYMRSLPFQNWQKGHTLKLNIFSGKRKELLTFEYRGLETIEVNNKRYTCYRITFKFTGDGGRKTSDDMDAWITADKARIPVQLEGKLPVGKVRCQLM